MLPGGGLLIDTPGMREMQLWDGNLADAFADIETLGRRAATFATAGTSEEPRCAVRAAVADGRLAPARLESFRKLQRELAAAGATAGSARADRREAQVAEPFTRRMRHFKPRE